MASKKVYVSPAVITREIDLSQIPQAVEGTGAVLIGLAQKGPAFLPVKVADFGEFRIRFGGTDPDMYMPYAAKLYLQNADNLRVVRVLGKGNPNRGYTVDLGKPFLLTFTNQAPATILSEAITGTGSISNFTTNGTVGVVPGYSTSAINVSGGYATLTAMLKTNQIYELSFMKSATGSGTQSFEFSLIRSTDNNALQADGAFVSTTASNSGMIIASSSAAFTETRMRFKTEPLFNTNGSPNPLLNGSQLYTIKFATTAPNNVSIDDILLTEQGVGEVLAVLRSRRDDTETYDMVEDVSITGNPFDFDLKATMNDGSTEILYNLSLDMNQKQFIGNIFGTDPQETHPGDQVTGLYIDSVLTYKLIDTALSQVFQSSSFTGSTSGVPTGTLGGEYGAYRYITGGYKNAQSPTVVSQPYFFNGKYTVYDLFKIHSLSDGEASNKDVKISITNIQTDTGNPKIAPKFQIVVRAFDDVDRRMIVLEQFTVDLNPESDSYIARVIGDRKQNVIISAPGAEPEIQFDGDNKNNSAYIRVEMFKGYPFQARPAGFRGPSGINPDIPEDHEFGAGYEIDMPYKTDHVLEGTGQATENTFLGFDLEGSNTVGIQDRLKGSYTAVDGAKPAKGFVITATNQESVWYVIEAYKNYLNAKEYINSYNPLTPWAGASGTTVWTHVMSGTLTAFGTTYSNIEQMVVSASSTSTPISGVVESLDAAEALVYSLTGNPSNYPNALFVNENGAKNYFAGYSTLLKYFTVVDTTRATDTIIEDAYQFTMPLFGGHDGIAPYKSLLGSINDGTLSAEFISAIQTIANADEIDINLLAIPGVHSGASSKNGKVTSIALETVERRADAFYIMDIGKPTTSFTRERITTEAMNTSVNEAVLSVAGYDSNYAAAYWPWVRIFDSEVNRLVWVPPSVVEMGVYSYNDRISYPWMAPAGFNRGVVKSAVEARYRPGQFNRDTLYEGRINPVATFVGQGIVTYGQKTLQKTASALDRINVRRLLLFARKTVASLARLVQFENNNARTQQRLVSLINPIFEQIMMKNGLTKFQVIIDETTNTPTVVDNNMLYGKILLQPAKTIEIIVLDFVLTKTGAIFEEIANQVNL